MKNVRVWRQFLHVPKKTAKGHTCLLFSAWVMFKWITHISQVSVHSECKNAQHRLYIASLRGLFIHCGLHLCGAQVKFSLILV